MLTEQNPPCAAKLGVPNCVAQKPVIDWLWSRPVKKASFFGSSARIRASHSTAVAIASSHSISRNSPRAALADPHQRLAQLRRRMLVHDAGGALAADDAAIDRVVAVALDVADAAILQMHFDAAAAGAHVAGRGLDLVGDLGRVVDDLARREIIAQPFAKSFPPIRRNFWRRCRSRSIAFSLWFGAARGRIETANVSDMSPSCPPPGRRYSKTTSVAGLQSRRRGVASSPRLEIPRWRRREPRRSPFAPRRDPDPGAP